MPRPLLESRKAVAASQHARPSAFGLTFDPINVSQAVERIASGPPGPQGRARLFVTPNIQHIALTRTMPELYRVLRDADLMTCDGFPLAMYASWNGCRIAGRITGREVVEQLLLRTPLSSRHVLFFLIDSAETAAAVGRWAHLRGLTDRVVVEVAPASFGEDAEACAALARRVKAAGTTMFFIGLGAPKSELFSGRFRNELGGCWALCIGQSIRVALGLVPTPPRFWVKCRLEWAWRIRREPRRLTLRYVQAAYGFVLAVFADQWARIRI